MCVCVCVCVEGALRLCALYRHKVLVLQDRSFELRLFLRIFAVVFGVLLVALVVHRILLLFKLRASKAVTLHSLLWLSVLGCGFRCPRIVGCDLCCSALSSVLSSIFDCCFVVRAAPFHGGKTLLSRIVCFLLLGCGFCSFSPFYFSSLCSLP